MTVSRNNEKIKAPATLTLSGYSSISEFHSLKTPNLKGAHHIILLVRLDQFRGGMLGSAYSRFFKTNEIPTQWLEIDKFKDIWMVIQQLIRKNMIMQVTILVTVV